MVKIVDRHDSETPYSYETPGRYAGNSASNTNCNESGSSVNCNTSGTSGGIYTPSRHIAYSVTGATFTLLLPDGRVAVVNCTSKYVPRGDYINRRSCRAPMVDSVEATFKGKNAKLRWNVSLTGSKMDSETYRILAVYPPTSATDPH